MATWQVLQALKPLADGMSKYFHFGDFLRVFARGESRGVHDYLDEAGFWRDLLGRDLEGRLSSDPLVLNDVVRLRGFLISEWFPRSPGTYWTADGQARRIWAKEQTERWDEETEVLSPQGKIQIVTGGVGTCRVMAHAGEGQKRYGVLCATSSGSCDAGIPLVLEEDVYHSVLDRLHDAQQVGNAIQADITGQLSALPFDRGELLIGARGAVVPEEIRGLLTQPLEVPCYFLRVESVLQTKTRESEYSLEASAWTLYSDQDGAWSYTYAAFDPRDRTDIDRATEFLIEYVRRHRGRRIYTDFDEHTLRLDARHPIGRVMDGVVNLAEDAGQFLTWANTLQGAREWRAPYRYL